MSFRERVRRKRGLVPLLVIGSTWLEHWATLTTPPKPAAEDPHARARCLLNGHAPPVPVAFIDADLQAVALMAQHDPRLAYVAGRAEHGQISQYLAGAPALIERYQNVPALARALIEAAMDAHRLGHPPGLPLPLLEAAAEGYLADSQWDLLEDDWFEQALAYTAAPLHGARGPLTRIRPRRGQSAPAHPTTASRLPRTTRSH
ncbi:hypothetical protein ACWEQP_32110 [Streptomyces sp. NPDC004044]